MIRAFSARYDLRMLWMAFAALFGVAIVVTIWKARPPASPPVLALFSVALAVATVFAGVVAMLLGATAAFGIWAVAFVLSFCWALAYTLYTLAH